jgi:hypothetical protein
MIRDILVSLSVGKPRDVAGEFATSVAGLFGAHLSAVAFAYEPPIGGSVLNGMAASVIDRWRADRRAEAERAQAGFNATIIAAQISADCRLLTERAADAARTFGALARSYDFSIVVQAETVDDFPLGQTTRLPQLAQPVSCLPAQFLRQPVTHPMFMRPWSTAIRSRPTATAPPGTTHSRVRDGAGALRRPADRAAVRRFPRRALPVEPTSP